MTCQVMKSLDLEALLSATKNNPDSVVDQLPAVLLQANKLIDDIAACSGVDSETSIEIESLIQTLQIVRNMCALRSATSNLLQASGLIPLVARCIDIVGSGAAQLNWRLPGVAAQALANAVATSPDLAAAAWPIVFPPRLLVLSHIRSGASPSATAVALLTFCRTVPEALDQLLTSGGGEILSALLNGHSHLLTQDEANDSIGVLVTYIAFQEDKLDLLFASLQGVGEEGGRWTGNPAPVNSSISITDIAALAQEPTIAQVLLLQELAVEAQQVQGVAMPPSPLGLDQMNTTGAQASMQFLIKLVEVLGQQSARGTALSEAQQQLLQDSLQLLRDIVARDDDGAALTNGVSLIPSLLTARIVPLLLSMLKALGPPKPSKSPQQQQQQQQNELGVKVIELAPALAAQAQELPREPPYYGYRTDVLAVLANLSHRRPAVQQQVVSLQAEPLVLAQCQVDFASPMAREWGLWAVRNLCEGSDEARAALNELKACAAQDNEELERAGVKVTLDEESGKVKVERRVPQ